MQRLYTFTVALLLAGCLTAKADVSVFGNTYTSGQAFRLEGIGLGEPLGGLVLFTPLENLDVTSVTLWLSGYDAQTGPNNPANSPGGPVYNGYAGIFGYLTNSLGDFEPYPLVASLAPPATNDGSAAPFTYSVSSGSVVLDAGQEYALWVVGDVQYYSTYWLNGGTPTGDAVYDGSLSSQPPGVFYPSSAIPAFTINTVPEPGVMGFVSLAILFGIGRVIGKRITSKEFTLSLT